LTTPENTFVRERRQEFWGESAEFWGEW